MEKKRLGNLELVRCVAMMMIIVLHFLGKGGLLRSMTYASWNFTDVLAWGLEILSMVAVNLYMLISGYLLCESRFRLSRLVQLLLQIVFYSVLFGLLGLALHTSTEELSIYYLLQIFLPVSMNQYWFMTAYVILYLLLPFIGTALAGMSKEAHRVVMILLLTAFGGIKTVLFAVRLATDTKGYDFLWYLTVFVAAAYFKKYGFAFLQNKTKNLIWYFALSAASMICMFATRGIYLSSGKLQGSLNLWTDYNQLIGFFAALFLFCFFVQCKPDSRLATAAAKVGPYTLGVYLMHENVGFRYAWQDWLGAKNVYDPISLLLFTALAVVVVFTLGILVDMGRAKLFGICHGVLGKNRTYNSLCGKIERADGYIKGTKQA